MKISVVTAVYNRAATVGQAVQSVLSQTHRDLEVIVQDGGSSDGTLERIEAIRDPRVRLESGPDQGIYDAINKGIRRADGAVIGLMHSDDFFPDDGILDRVAGTFAARDVDGVYGDLQYVSARDTGKVLRYWKSGDFTRKKLGRGWMPPHPTLYLKREVYQHLGLYDLEFRISADYEAILRYTIKGHLRLAYIPEVLVKMRAGGESNRSLGRILRKSQEDFRAIRRHNVGGVGTLALKNLGKIRQFIDRPDMT